MVNRQLKSQRLADQVSEICVRLSQFGWQDVFLMHGLDILSGDIESVFSKSLQIDRKQPGFEDFSLEGDKAIEPFQPAQSLLFHGLASPQVISWKDQNGKENMISGFPTFDEICIVENYVYGIRTPSIQELRVKANSSSLAIVVFASEYRPSINTVHKRHADKCFSRVGISRVGIKDAEYIGASRGYLPFDNDKYATKIIPCYFSAYIAVQAKGDEKNFGPLRFQTDPKTGDASRNFWVPLHKLFSGSECIRGENLHLNLTATHINEKLRKVHRQLSGSGFDAGYNTGWREPDISKPPFRFHDNIADIQLLTGQGEGFVLPVRHDRLVDIAYYNKNILSYKAPVNKPPFRSSVIIDSKKHGGRSAPEYVYVRQELLPDGTFKDLNEEKDLLGIIEKGGYDAVHYVDFTGDGCVEVECPELALSLPEVISAYSMVSATDFFPLVKQYDLIDWWEQSVPEELEKTIWPSNPGPPLALCDSRLPANLSLTLKKLNIQNDPKTVFKPEDDSISSITGLYQSCGGRLTQIDEPKNLRISTLPDGAAGVFAPGWDISIDRTEESSDDETSTYTPGTTFFNNYGLGSPFPEDSMLCAALSSFWPAAAPDITRTFVPGRYATATPLTDDVTGQDGNVSWNEFPAPKIYDQQKQLVEYLRLEYGDFVKAAYNNKFDFSKISKISSKEYGARTLAMARVYVCLGATTTEDKRNWVVFSFMQSRVNHPERMQAEKESGSSLSSEYCYRFIMFKHKETLEQHPDFKMKLVRYDELRTIFADPQAVIQKTKDGWKSFKY